VNEQKIPGALRRLVRRPAYKDGKPAGTREIASKEVLDWAASEREIVIITVDGHRYRADKPTGKAAASASSEDDDDERGGEES